MTRRGQKRPVARDRTEQEGEHIDLIGAVDVLRQNIARADAMVCATEHQLERFTWAGSDDREGSDGCDDRRLEHLSHLLGAAKEAVQAAVCAGGEVAAELVKHQRGT